MSNSLLQKSLRNLTCNCEGHQQEPLSYICVSQECDRSPVMCYLCSMEAHQDHEKVALRVFLKQIMAVETSPERLTLLCAQIDHIFHKIQSELKKYKKSFVHPQLVIRTFQSYRRMNIQSLLDFYKTIEQMSEMFEESEMDLVERLNWFLKNIYWKYFAEVQIEDWEKTNVAEVVLNSKIEDLNGVFETLEKLRTTNKLNDNEVLNLFPLLIEEERKLKVYFSEDLKPSNMTLLSPTNAKMTTSGSERLLILEPCLSKTHSPKRWGVRIIKLASWIGVGVCHINAIKKSNYMFNYSNTGHGNYLISSNGYSWSSYQKEYNSKFQSFSYTTGDVIHVEYNPRERIVKWKKESDPLQPTYQLEVEANDDPIHPEINLTGINDEVEIINF